MKRIMAQTKCWLTPGLSWCQPTFCLSHNSFHVAFFMETNLFTMVL